MEQKEIRQWIEQKLPEIVEDLKRICRIRSVADVSGNPDAKPFGSGCIEVLEEMLAMGRENGFQVRNHENYVGCISLPGKNKKQIGIWTHLDVVEEGEGWDFSPFEPVVKDGYFIARGCQDNKSSSIMGLYVLKYMKEHHISLEHTLELYLGTCEEQGMQDLDYYTEHYSCPALSLVPDSGFPVCCGERGAFNGELRQQAQCSKAVLGVQCDCGLYTVPDKAEIVLRYEEALWTKCGECPQGITVSRKHIEGGEIVTIRAEGISTQAANPSKGKNALTLLSRFLCERKVLENLPEEKAFQLICDMNADHQGTALHTACRDELSGPMVQVATQLMLTERHLTICFISKYPVTCNEYPFVQEAQAAAGEYGFDLKVTRLSKANYFSPEREVVGILTRCSNQVLGRKDQPFVMSGGTYAHKLPDAFAFGTGMPLPKPPEGLFRPGHGDYHQPDESISLERICRALEIYISGILEIDGCQL